MGKKTLLIFGIIAAVVLAFVFLGSGGRTTKAADGTELDPNVVSSLEQFRSALEPIEDENFVKFCGHWTDTIEEKEFKEFMANYKHVHDATVAKIRTLNKMKEDGYKQRVANWQRVQEEATLLFRRARKSQANEEEATS